MLSGFWMKLSHTSLPLHINQCRPKYVTGLDNRDFLGTSPEFSTPRVALIFFEIVDLSCCHTKVTLLRQTRSQTGLLCNT